MIIEQTKKPKDSAPVPLYQKILLDMAKVNKSRELVKEQNIAGLQLLILSGLVFPNYPIRLYSLQSITHSYTPLVKTSLAFLGMDFAVKCMFDKIGQHIQIPVVGTYIGYFSKYHWYRYATLRFVGNCQYSFQIIPPIWIILFHLDSMIQDYVIMKTSYLMHNLLKKPNHNSLKSHYLCSIADSVGMTVGSLVTFPIEVLLTMFIIDDHHGIPFYQTLGSLSCWTMSRVFLKEMCNRVLAGFITLEAGWLFVKWRL